MLGRWKPEDGQHVMEAMFGEKGFLRETYSSGGIFTEKQDIQKFYT